MSDSFVASEEQQSAAARLSQDHRALDLLLSSLLTSLENGDSRRIFKQLDEFWARLAIHIRAENLHLFPALLKAGGAVITNDRLATSKTTDVLAQLREDHNFFMQELAEAVQLMRESLATSDDSLRNEQLNNVRRLIHAVQVRLDSHNQLEENFVYNLPETILTPPAREQLTAGIRRELENLPPRLRD